MVSALHIRAAARGPCASRCGAPTTHICVVVGVGAGMGPVPPVPVLHTLMMLLCTCCCHDGPCHADDADAALSMVVMLEHIVSCSH